MLEPISARRSVRKYTAEPVSDAAVEQIIEAARLAPSGHNTQPWNFIVVRSDGQRRAIAEVARRQSWMVTAPVHIVCVGDVGCRLDDCAGPALDETSDLFELKQVIRDTAIAVEHLVLEAQSLGLGTCWVAWFTQADMRRVVGTPDNTYIVAVITVGHPAESPKPRPRRTLTEIVRRERW